ncbi:MAG: hypothetical protein H6732_06300 [Alphaproteobacteria bacterium]|nr:hypothetical protein [Alphaproteobacteria bacterium]
MDDTRTLLAASTDDLKVVVEQPVAGVAGWKAHQVRVADPHEAAELFAKREERLHRGEGLVADEEVDVACRAHVAVDPDREAADEDVRDAELRETS